MHRIRITSSLSSDELARLAKGIKAAGVFLLCDDGRKGTYKTSDMIYFVGINGFVSYNEVNKVNKRRSKKV